MRKTAGPLRYTPSMPPGTVAGQGTVMAEWEEQGLTADTVLIAVGGGGLIGGAMAWLEGDANWLGLSHLTRPRSPRH